MNDSYTKLDWGNITPEFYSEKNNTAVLVSNYFLENPESINRCIRFIKGRTKWYKLNLPKHCVIEIIIDDIGQSITERDKKLIENELMYGAENIKFLSRG
jgi:hypothetical protein